ncbi:MAG: TolC family protein [Candidatus Zixiibacteriota bacterium]
MKKSYRFSKRIMLLCRAIILLCVIVLYGQSALQARELTLDEALGIAFANSPTMKRVGYSLDMSRHNLEAQNASLKSQFSLTLTPYRYSKSQDYANYADGYVTSESKSSDFVFSISQPIKWTDGTFNISESFSWEENATTQPFFDRDTTTSVSAYTSRLRISFSQPLFTYNRTKLQLKELELALENAQLDYSIQKLQIEQQVTQAFLNLFYLKRSSEITQEEFTNASESYDIINSKVEAGISAKEELFQAELTQASSQASLENSRMQLENAQDNFKILLGLPLEEEITVNADIKKLIIDVQLVKAINHGLANRMELRQSDIDIQNSMNNLIQTGAQNEFYGSVNLSYGLTGVDETNVSDIYQSPTRTHGFNVTFNVPLWDWGQKKHQIKSAETQVARTQLNAEEERKQIMYEIRESYRNLLNQKLQIEIAEKNVKNARLTYEINLEKYKNGDLSSKDLSFYQTQLSSEQLNEVSSLINYQLALLELKIRTLWDFQNDKPVVIRNQEN